MYLQEARETAKALTRTRRLDHAILFDGVDYSICMMHELKGKPIEIIKHDANSSKISENEESNSFVSRKKKKTATRKAL